MTLHTHSTNANIIKKCWKFICKNDPSFTGHIYGQKLSEAKHELHLQHKDDKAVMAENGYIFLRAKDMDLLHRKPMHLIKRLTTEQVSVLCNAYGYNNKQPRNHSYLKRTKQYGKDVEALVGLGLVHPLRGNADVCLTALGREAVCSIQPTPRKKLQS